MQLRLIRIGLLTLGAGLVGWSLSAAPAAAAGTAVTDAAVTDAAVTDAAVTDAARPLRAGQAALETGQAKTAESLFRKALDLDSDLLPAYWGLAQSLEAQQHLSEALEVYAQLGEGLLAAGVTDEARRAFERALDLDPHRAALWALLGRVSSLQHRYRAAAEQLERATELGARDLRTLLYLGAAQWETGQLEEAEATYRRALVIGGALAAHQLGRLLLWQGRHGEAVEILQAAANELPGAADSRLDLARAQLADGQIEAAITTFHEAIRLAPQRSHAHYGLARAFARQGDTEGAARQLETYRQLYEQEQARVAEQELVKARTGKGWELLRSGDADGAFGVFESLPVTADSLFGLAEAELARGRANRAVTTLEQAVALAPERGELRLRLAEARLRVAEARTPERP